jgi:serine/threonine protein phosphatase PrpC
MRWEQQVQYASQSDIGLRRKNNEDACAAVVCGEEGEWRERGHLFVVADGMGGHAVGELASKLATETVPHTFFKLPPADPAVLLRQAIVAANEAIHRRGSENRDFQRMGTTCTAAALTLRGLFVGHVGDSRIYRIRRDRIDQLSFDHSLVWELQRKHPKAAAQLNLAEHKNVITRSLGPEANVEVDLEGPYPIFPGDIYVLCTDGLSGQVSDEEIGGIARELSPSQACRLLVNLANLRGGGDNCTVQVVRVGELPANVPPAVEEPPRPEHGLGWAWLAGFWIVALLLVWGLSLFLFGNPVEGAFMTAVSGTGLTVLTWLAWRKQRLEYVPPTGDDASRTNYWRPYRTAIAKPSEELFEELAQLESQIQRAAEEERWSVDWTSHKQAVEAAQKAAEQGRHAKAIRDVARAIDSLMTELPRPESGEILAARAAE